VAVLMVGQECERRDIIIRSRDDKLQRILEIHPSNDALQYPLILHHGTPAPGRLQHLHPGIRSI